MDLNFAYSRASPEHAGFIYAIERLSFADPWSLKSIEDEFESGFARYFVAVPDVSVAERDRVIGIVGYCGYWSIVDEAHITNIAVHPDYRRRGAGAGLLAVMLDDIAASGHTAATLETRVDNDAAIRLYGRFGFERSGLRKKYYDNGKKDALIMWKKIA